MPGAAKRGQPRSTIDFRQLVAAGKLVIVNLNAFDVGEDTAALIGGTLVNLAARAISGQALLSPDARKPVTLVIDEFHMLPGADYEQVLGELAKYDSADGALTAAINTARGTAAEALPVLAYHTGDERVWTTIERLGGHAAISWRCASAG